MLRELWRRANDKLHAQNPTSIEEAIEAWENDINERNKEGNKIVRGLDGKPIEVIMVKRGKNSVFGFLINGEVQEQFQIGGHMQSLEQAVGMLGFRQFAENNLFDGWYELKGIQRFDAQVSRENQGFVFGQPGPLPDSLKIKGRPF